MKKMQDVKWFTDALNSIDDLILIKDGKSKIL